jgi:cytochrome c oxidase subunit 1
VGIQYLVVAMVILAIGGTLAMLIRTQLGISMELFNPNTYNSFVGTHGVAMVVGMIVVVTGPVGNFIVPMMVGARDMAFPRLNALSLWLVVAALIPLVMSLFMGGIRDGWTVYQPLAIQAPPGAVGYIFFIVIFSISTAVSSVNLLVTIIRMRARGMTWSRTPIFVYSVAASVGLALPTAHSRRVSSSPSAVAVSGFTNTSSGSSATPRCMSSCCQPSGHAWK